MPKYKLHDSVVDRLDIQFTYHAPKGDQVERYTQLRAKAREFATLVAELTPYSREQTIAIDKISEAVMHANAAIARHENGVLAGDDDG